MSIRLDTRAAALGVRLRKQTQAFTVCMRRCLVVLGASVEKPVITGTNVLQPAGLASPGTLVRYSHDQLMMMTDD